NHTIPHQATSIAHSQSPESWLIHVPGLKVGMPATPADAKGLLITAINDRDPVVILEPAALYAGLSVVPTGEHRVPFGRPTSCARVGISRSSPMGHRYPPRLPPPKKPKATPSVWKSLISGG